MTVIATAGHVDHGKSAIVEALTGVDPDRWAQEKARDLTLDLGFGQAHLAAGPLSLVDVPGHDRYLSNMVAGVGAIDGCLFVVAATEGWRPQSEEHLAILQLLGVTRAVVALTMVDRADATTAAVARLEVEERLRDTAWAEAEIVEVAAPIGVGVAELRSALERLVARIPAPIDHGRPRLWIDRAFTIRGAGTVVTGTLGGGTLCVDGQVTVVPGGATSRIRSIEVHGERVASVGPGHRVALNLADLPTRGLGRGQAMVHQSSWAPTARFDASLTVLPSQRAPVTRRGSSLLHLGTGVWAVGLRVLGGAAIAPGTSGLVRLHLPLAVPLLPGDRFVLRDAGRGSTLGGGEVLDIAPVLSAANAAPDRAADRVIREHGVIDVDRLAALTGEWRTPTFGQWVLSPAALAHQQAEVLAIVAASMPLGTDLATLSDLGRALVRSVLLPTVEVVDGLVRIAGTDDALVSHPWVAELAATPFRPPTADGVDPREIRMLVRRGLVMELAGIHFHPSAIALAAERLMPLRDDLGGFTLSQARTALATSRKYALPLLEELDARGTTLRDGDRRVFRMLNDG